MKKMLPFLGWVVAAVIFLTMIAISMPNYMRVNDRTAREEAAKFFSSEGYDGDWESGSPSNSGYDSQYREQSRGGNMKTAAPPMEPGASHPDAAAPGAKHSGSQAPTGGSSVVANALEAAGLAEKLESWFLPQAYAEDHGIDERYLIRTGDCSIKVEKYKATADRIAGIAKKYEGMISDSYSSKDYDGTVTGWIKLRVPAEKFYSAWNDLLATGELESESVTSSDVSQQYVGQISRLKNLLAEQAVLQGMLEDALDVQRKRGLGEGYSMLLDTQERLFDVTAEIESTEDRLNALADQITRSTITVNISEVKKLPGQVKEKFSWGMSETAGQAFKDLKLNMRSMAQGLVAFAITGLPVLIIWALLIWLAVVLFKRFVLPKLMAKDKTAADTDVVEKGDPDNVEK